MAFVTDTLRAALLELDTPLLADVGLGRGAAKADGEKRGWS